MRRAWATVVSCFAALSLAASDDVEGSQAFAAIEECDASMLFQRRFAVSLESHEQEAKREAQLPQRSGTKGLAPSPQQGFRQMQALLLGSSPLRAALFAGTIIIMSPVAAGKARQDPSRTADAAWIRWAVLCALGLMTLRMVVGLSSGSMALVADAGATSVLGYACAYMLEHMKLSAPARRAVPLDMLGAMTSLAFVVCSTLPPFLEAVDRFRGRPGLPAPGPVERVPLALAAAGAAGGAALVALRLVAAGAAGAAPLSEGPVASALTAKCGGRGDLNAGAVLLRVASEGLQSLGILGTGVLASFGLVEDFGQASATCAVAVASLVALGAVPLLWRVVGHATGRTAVPEAHGFEPGWPMLMAPPQALRERQPGDADGAHGGGKVSQHWWW